MTGPLLARSAPAPRGQTYLADRVISKVAAEAAREATPPHGGLAPGSPAMGSPALGDPAPGDSAMGDLAHDGPTEGDSAQRDLGQRDPAQQESPEEGAGRFGQGRLPRAEVRRRDGRDGPGAELRVTLDLAYPVVVARVAQKVRLHVRERVEQLCGEPVRAVDVHVDRLRVAGTGGARRVR